VDMQGVDSYMTHW